MKTITFSAFIAFLTCNGHGGTFLNLGFDEANTNNLIEAFTLPDGSFSSGHASTTELMPGWTLELNGSPFSRLNVDTLYASRLGYATLYSLAMHEKGQPFPVEGRYSLAFWPGPGPFGGLVSQYTLKQTGDIPADAQSIRFTGYGSQLELRINEIQVPLIYIYEPFTANVYRRAEVFGNIAFFAGQTVELKFNTIMPNIAVDFGIDSIFFSPEIVPEAGAPFLLCLGGAVLAVARLRRSRAPDIARRLI